jgi:hypothetical protein
MGTMLIRLAILQVLLGTPLFSIITIPIFLYKDGDGDIRFSRLSALDGS